MIRPHFLIVSTSLLFFPMLDATIKGTGVLLLVCAVCLVLRRDSAATRHLVWATAVMLLLAMPLLSILLPKWRVLPNWSQANLDVASSSRSSPEPVAEAQHATDTPRSLQFLENDAGGPRQVVQPRFSVPPKVELRPALPNETDFNTRQGLLATIVGQSAALVTIVWLVGCVLVLLRLLIAVLLLRKSASRCRALAPLAEGRASPPNDRCAGERALRAAMDVAVVRLGIKRSVQLLLDPQQSMPVVWGLLRLRLRLPAEAVDWSVEQQRSVLLHELAHIRRHDLVILTMTQFACALNWFNPLMWFAARRLHIERERACDDLVLSAGVRPSTYAGHLVELVSRLRPAAWTRSCGLAMACKSSLEGRLLAVLSEKLNRRGVNRALTAAALILGAAVAIPVAMLRAADAKWNPPQAAHIGTNEFSTFCDHDGKTAAFIIAYHGDFGSSSTYDSNPKTRTWTSTGTLTAKKPGIAFSFHRVHTAPDKLAITSAPAGARDFSKPAPAAREFGQKEYDLTKGRVFLVHDDGVVRQLAIEAPVITESEHAKKFAERLAAAFPPQTREQTVQQQNSQKPKDGARLEPGTEERLQWGKPVNGLRAALVRPQALGEPEAGEVMDLKLVVQNVSDAPVRFSTTSVASKSPYLTVRKDGVPLAAFHDSKPSRADFMLQPRAVAVLRMFAERTKGSSIAAESPDLTFTAELEIENAPAGAWTGKLVTAETSAAFAGYGLLPKHKDAQSLFKVWGVGARADGKIPGALIGLLAEGVTTFTKYNPTWETTPQLLKMLPRLDATRDWSGQDAIALLDELAAVQATPIKMVLDKEWERTIRTGAPLPPELANAPWGEALPNGLRMAWLLEPRAAEHRLGTPLKSRILIHNAGKEPVVFRTRTWHQGNHKASDAKGADVKVESVEWTTIGRLVPFRLAPGEFVEVNATGIGVGANRNSEDWQNTRVGSWVEAQEGDEVTVTTKPVPLCDWKENPPADGEPRWWLDFIAARLARELPLPAAAAERTRLLYRVALDLFGTPLGAEENAAFVADREPNALDSLAKRLAHRAGLTPYSGSLTSGPTKFRVLPADPDAAKRPRTASNPGRYTLGENVRLVVIRRPVGERIVNEASIQFFSPDPAKPAPGEPHELKLPDGYDTWAAAWVRGGTVLWLQEKSGVRRYDFANPAKVKEEAEEPDKVPAEIREALRGALTVPAPKPAPKGGASVPSPPASVRP